MTKQEALRKAASTAAFLFSALVGPATPGATDGSFSIPRQGVEFLTGDSWKQDSYIIRLYGVQSCLRGKTYVDKNSSTQDCGLVSMSFLAAIIHDVGASCRPVASISAGNRPGVNTLIAVCTVEIGDKSTDLGTLLITQGFAFAAFASDGKPVYPPYEAYEATARQAKRGLWIFDRIPHPSTDLLKPQ